MLKQAFAKCPRRRGCAGTPKQGQAPYYFLVRRHGHGRGHFLENEIIRQTSISDFFVESKKKFAPPVVTNVKFFGFDAPPSWTLFENKLPPGTPNFWKSDSETKNLRHRDHWQLFENKQNGPSTLHFSEF